MIGVEWHESFLTALLIWYKMQIAFMGKTTIDMENFLKLIKSPKIDSLRLTPNHSLAFLATLTDFKDVPCNFTNLGSLLKHEHYVYLLKCLKERDRIEIIEECNLNFTVSYDEEYVVVSGTLQQWLVAFIAGCSESALESYRQFMNLVLLDMERKELGQLWVNYSKASLKGNTFKLLEKK